MPDYTIKDPATGRVAVVRGEAPPTEAELTDIFAKMPKNAPPMMGSQATSYLGDVARYAGGEVIGFARGLTDLVNPMTYVNAAKGVTQGVKDMPAYVRGMSMDDVRRAPGQAAEAAEEFVRDPEAVGRTLGNVVAGKAVPVVVAAVKAAPAALEAVRSAPTVEAIRYGLAKRLGIDPVSVTNVEIQTARRGLEAAKRKANMAKTAADARVAAQAAAPPSVPVDRYMPNVSPETPPTAPPEAPPPEALPQASAPVPEAPSPAPPAEAPQGPPVSPAIALRDVLNASLRDKITVTAKERAALMDLIAEGHDPQVVWAEFKRLKQQQMAGAALAASPSFANLPTDAEVASARPGVAPGPATIVNPYRK